MKKTFLTIIAAGFGFSVAFAQTTPIEENQQEAQVQTEQTVANQGEKDRRQVEMSELSQEAQDAFKEGQYSDLQVLAVYEITSESAEAATVYEFELAQAQAGEAADAGTTDDGLAGIETEQVSARQPDIILQIDEKGQVVKEENLDEMNKEEEKE
jgi:hypothetical protein